MGRESAETCFFRPFRERFWPFRGCHGPGDRYPNRQLKTKSRHVWLFAGSPPHSLHSLKRFFCRRPIVIKHFGGKGASPALLSVPPCTEAPRSHPRPKALGFRIGASTVSSGGAGTFHTSGGPCSSARPRCRRIAGIGSSARHRTRRGYARHAASEQNQSLNSSRVLG